MVSLTRKNTSFSASNAPRLTRQRTLKSDCLRAFSELYQLAAVECPEWIRDSAFAIEG